MDAGERDFPAGRYQVARPPGAVQATVRRHGLVARGSARPDGNRTRSIVPSAACSRTLRVPASLRSSPGAVRTARGSLLPSVHLAPGTALPCEPTGPSSSSRATSWSPEQIGRLRCLLPLPQSSSRRCWSSLHRSWQWCAFEAASSPSSLAWRADIERRTGETPRWRQQGRLPAGLVRGFFCEDRLCNLPSSAEIEQKRLPARPRPAMGRGFSFP
jgi:hypothetical protein